MRPLVSTNNLVVAALLAVPVNVGLMYTLNVLNLHLIPYTIVDFEFAWTVARAQAMLALWAPPSNALWALNLSLWLDYAFMVTYALGLMTLVALAGRAPQPAPLKRLGALAVWLPALAALADALENAQLLSLMPPAPLNDTALMVAGLAAGVKFTLLGLAALYLLAVLVAWAFSRLRPTSPTPLPR